MQVRKRNTSTTDGCRMSVTLLLESCRLLDIFLGYWQVFFLHLRCGQSRWKDPPYLSVEGFRYAQGPHVTYGKIFLGACRCIDGCCYVRWLLKRLPENWGSIVVVRGGGSVRLAPALAVVAKENDRVMETSKGKARIFGGIVHIL